MTMTQTHRVTGGGSGAFGRFLSGAALLGVLTLILAGCGNPDAELCRQACEKLNTCNEEVDEIADYPSTWLQECQSECDRADVIGTERAECVMNSECPVIWNDCMGK